MTTQAIPEGSTEIQTGLWAAIHSFVVNGRTYSFYDLYSSEGYCFWDTMTSENYDEDGNLLPLEQRLFAQYARTSFTSIDELNEVFFFFFFHPGYENVSA